MLEGTSLEVSEYWLVSLFIPHSIKSNSITKANILLWLLQVLSYSSDPFVSLSSSREKFRSDASPVSVRVLGDPDATVTYRAVSKANVSVPMNSVNISGNEMVTDYLLDDPNSFLKVRVC